MKIPTTPPQLFLVIILGVLSAVSSLANETKMLRYPDISRDKIVFCYGGDIYIGNLDGRKVKQITSFIGEEMFPKFSPDGRHIAFTAEFDGNREVYVMPVEGGKLKRLTFHQSDEFVVGWHPDGTQVLFRSNRSSHSYRFNRLHMVAVTGGLPEVLDIPEADLAGYNAQGSKIAFCRTSTETLLWKGYRGGAIPKIWTYDFKTHQAELVVSDESTNHHPMWSGDFIYFVSDRGTEGEQNLWSYNCNSKKVSQLTFYKDWPVKWPELDRERIIFENEGRLCLYSINNNKITVLNIEIPLPATLLTPVIKSVRDKISVPSLSPDGKKVIVSARGDLFYLDSEKNVTRNLTATPGVNERSPVWSPDGQYFAYISDVSGEEQIYLQSPEGGREPILLTNVLKSKLGKLAWSPDSRKIGYADQRACFYTIDIATRETKKIFFDFYFASQRFVAAEWSPDSKWLVYTKLNPNWFGSIFLYSVEAGKEYRVTDEMVNASGPRFDPDGKYLYWIADCNVSIEDSYLDGNHHMVNPSKIMMATLQKGQPTPMHIDLAGLGNRITPLPVESSNYGDLIALKGKLLYQSSPAHGEPAIKMFDLEAQKESVFLKDSYFCIPSAPGDKVVYLAPGTIGILDIKADQKAGDGAVDLSGLTMAIDYRKEWVQLFNEAWRIQRDFFYDETLHGIDWDSMKRKYEQLLPNIPTRRDLNYLLEDLFSELRQSHVEIEGGDMPDIPESNIGLLGIDLVQDRKNGFYRITKIYQGQNWDEGTSSPLTLPGMNCNPGDYLLAIDGIPLTNGINPDSLLVGRAGEKIEVTINDKPTVSGSRKLTVKPAAYSPELGDLLRYNDWVLGNMEKVNKATGGKIGYIHIPDTYYPGIESFFRYFYAQSHKEGLILDVRFNSGGFNPYWMIERMNRTMMYYSRMPYGKAPMKEPDGGFFGSKVCMINEWTESGGENFATIFHLTNKGAIIGERTSGNLASAQGMYLMDRGIVTYPAEGKQTADGTKFVENTGVSPDIIVTNRPDDYIQGIDRQLERSIKEILAQIKVE